MFETLKNSRHKLSLFKRDVEAYLHFASSGNAVERRTDFAKPNLKLILLIHGFGTTRKSVAILETRLREDGFDVFSINFGGFLNRLNTRGIDTLAKQVKAKIDSLKERYNIGKIAIIGHSKGGLIGRYYVTMLGGDKDVHTLITLGTPHNGSPIAIFAALSVIGLISKSVWQMMPHSLFMRRLRKAPLPPNVRFISIYSADDEVISPARARIEAPADADNVTNVELSGYSHTDYLIKRGVYEEVRKYLAMRA
jgi:triacylglycerol esterase/lipase EstA (alpha/beta hydrolase family)